MKYDEVRVIAPTGMLGAGFKVDSFERGLSMDPHVIACDAGSTDPGPAYLGSDNPKMSYGAVKRDLQILLRGRQQLGIPLVIGSCGTSGRDAGVDWFKQIALEIAKEEDMHFKLALIYANQSSERVVDAYHSGNLIPLDPAPEIDEDVIRQSNIVGMMGTEPIEKALNCGADVVLAGRASDAALFAVYPIMLGADPGLSWHAAKTLECGAACAVVPTGDGLVGRIRSDHFEIETLDPAGQITPQGLAAHTLYENASPYYIREPAGNVDSSDARYEAVDDRIARVYGSKFIRAEKYTIKLEGATRIGYQTIAMGGIRDPYIIRSIDNYLDEANEYFSHRVKDIFAGEVRESDYQISYRIYGRDGVMGETEPLRTTCEPHEVGILITVTACSQSIASAICSFVAHVCAHLPVKEYHGLISSIAYPFSPPEVERGAAYRFTLNHVFTPEDPCDPFRTELREV